MVEQRSANWKSTRSKTAPELEPHRLSATALGLLRFAGPQLHAEQRLSFPIKVSKERKFETGDIVLSKGEGGVGFYLIIDGSVGIRSDGNILAKLGPGQFFGEMAVLDNQPRSADVVAAEPSRCFIVSEWSFKALISENPRIALKTLQEPVRRLRDANKSQDQEPIHLHDGSL
jgi:CRP/FNR family cyclic AMP-dependent transcriptional regulator